MDVFFDPIFLKHDTSDHPENAERLNLILKELAGKIKKPRNGEEFLPLAHTQEYMAEVKKICDSGGGYLDMDTPISRETYKAACYAVGAAVDASESALKGDGGFALVRPPGHHAFAGHGSGFCVFNSMAIAAIRLAEKGKRVFILDIDIHHGNGTDEIVFNKPNIKFLSIHQSPLYPGSGLSSRGTNIINLLMPPETGDDAYIGLLERRVMLEIEKFRPDVIGVSVGFDACASDRGWVSGNAFNLTEKTYKKIRELLRPYKVFYVLEGGYNPESVLMGIKALTGL
jgi:acetoin utilization deacetylase AcuC-like enzyme